MLRRLASASSPTAFFCGQRRTVFCEKARAGMICRLDKRLWRLTSVTKAQKGQGAASFHIILTELETGKKKDMSSVAANFDLPEARYERVKLLFSGFDDDDNACFVYPQHSSQAGQEVNIPGSKLKEQHQKFLAVGMPVDLMHIASDEEVAGSEDMWLELNIPTNYEYTVEKFQMKGVYKMAVLAECDGTVSVSDVVQPGDRIKVTIRPDGTAGFAGKI